MVSMARFLHRRPMSLTMKNLMKGTTMALAAACVLPAMAVTTYGPSSYQQFSDSPFDGMGFSEYFHLEDLEDGAFNTPGVTLNVPTGTWRIDAPGEFTDSVDGDDGVLDGNGQGGQSIEVLQGNTIQFTFDDAALGLLPTHAGIVWTDTFPAPDDVTVRIYDDAMTVVSSLTAQQLGDKVYKGETEEDTFFGFKYLGGIKMIELEQAGDNNFEVDHLQYGAVPEPASMLALGAGLAALAARRKKKA
jgi:hypothetical protein